jgi:acyl-coenzyme A synthetase/AMP-(fatty) acid ligase
VLAQNATAGGLAAVREHWDLLICDRLPAEQSQAFVLGHGADGDWAMRALNSERCRFNLFTSGSTGAPKLVQKTLAVMEREAAAIETLVGQQVPEDARVFGTVTHQHLFGLSYKLFWPLCSGRCIDGTIYDLWENLLGQEIRGAVIVTSPAHLTRLEQDALPSDRRPSIILSAGAFLPLSASKVAAKVFGRAVCEIYGSTETGTIAWRDRADIDLPWQSMPGVSVTQGSGGILRLRSPFLPDATEFDTNDSIQMLDGGGFRLLARTDRIAKIDGKRVSLPEVEAQLGASLFVSEVAALVLPGEQAILAAAIVPSATGREELAKIGAFRLGRLLRDELGRTQEAAGKPRRWRFVDALPRNDMGKILQQDLIQLFMPERLPTEPDLHAVRQNGDAVEIDLFNRPDLLQLHGHFPNMPIIPGVAQIDWAVKLAARHFGISIDVAANFQVKFHRLTLPGTLVTLKLAHDADRRRLSFAYHQGAQVLTSGFIRMPAP